MPFEFGKKHGNGYINHRDQKVVYKPLKKSKECTTPTIMQFRINNDLVLKQCPESCDFFEECLNKSLELKNENAM